MRFGLLIYGQLADQSGGYLYDRQLVEHLRAHGHQVNIISLPWRSYARHLADNLDQSLYRRLRDLDVDILLQDELNHPSFFDINPRLRDEVAYPIISIVHHLRSSEQHPAALLPLYRAVERRYLRSVDGFIFNSATTQGVVNDLLGEQKPSVVAMPAGDRLGADISEGAIRTRAHQSGPLRVVFLGALIPRKAPHLVLQALSTLSEGQAQAYIVGSPDADPGYARGLRQMHRILNLGAQVQFTGHLAPSELAELLANCHLLVLPSSYEGFGIAYLEGMAFGLPAIGTTVGAAGDLIQDLHNGFLIEPGDHQALTELLAELHRNRQQLSAMGISARRRFPQHPGWEESMATARHFLEDYNHPT